MRHYIGFRDIIPPKWRIQQKTLVRKMENDIDTGLRSLSLAIRDIYIYIYVYSRVALNALLSDVLLVCYSLVVVHMAYGLPLAFCNFEEPRPEL